MKTYVYVDGFNLYYGAVKGTPYKWLDLAKLCALLLPKNQILKIKYFTALVSARPDGDFTSGTPIPKDGFIPLSKTAASHPFSSSRVGKIGKNPALAFLAGLIGRTVFDQGNGAQHLMEP